MRSVRSAQGRGGRSSRPVGHLPRPLARKALAGAGLSAALAGGLLSGCGTAPYAATVNDQPISVQQLAAQARYWASSPAFVAYQNAQFASEEAAAAQSGQTNVPNNTVQGNGTGSGVYGMYWTTLELSNMITASVLEQYLAKAGLVPSANQVAAAWSAEWASNATIWSQVGEAARTAGALYDAQRAQLVPVANAKADEQFYTAHKAYFWSSVCVLEDDVSVVGASGKLDLGASRREAERAAAALRASPSSPPASVAGGSRYCDSPEQLLAGPAAFGTKVNALAPGQVAVLGKSWGYQVVQVTSRAPIPYGSAIAGDIEVVTSYGGAQGQPNSQTRIIKILKSARVRVNPIFGKWSTKLPAPYAPQVLAPGERA